MEIRKSVKISIASVMRNPKLLKFIPDPLKTKKMLKQAIEKLPLVIRYVPDRYKTQQMSDKAII